MTERQLQTKVERAWHSHVAAYPSMTAAQLASAVGRACRVSPAVVLEYVSSMTADERSEYLAYVARQESRSFTRGQNVSGWQGV